jgi:hypothetical protein
VRNCAIGGATGCAIERVVATGNWVPIAAGNPWNEFKWREAGIRALIGKIFAHSCVHFFCSVEEIGMSVLARYMRSGQQR